MTTEPSNSAASSVTLDPAIHQLTRSLRLSFASKGFGWGAVAGLSIVCALAVASRFIPIWTSTEIRQYTLWFLITGTVLGTVVGVTWPIPLTHRLRIFDRCLALDDRLTTAWEIGQGQIAASLEMSRLQLQQTLYKVGETQANTVFTIHPTRTSIIITVVLSLILIPLLFTANPQDTILRSRKLEAQFVSLAVDQLDSTADALTEQTVLSPDEKAAAVEIIEQAISLLEDSQSDLADKQAALIEAEYQLENMRTPGSRDITQQIASIPSLSENTPLLDESIIQRISEALSKGDLDFATDHLSDIAQSEPGENLTKDEFQALGDMMAQLAAALQEKQPETASALRALSEAIAEDNSSSIQEALQQAAEALVGLEKVQSQDAALQQAQAGVQLAQQPLRQASGQGFDAGMGQNNSGTNEPVTSAGQPGNLSRDGAGEGTGVGADGEGSQQNGNSTLSSDTEMERVAAVGGEITLPRSAIEGNPVLVPGTQNESRVPYEKVYMEYADAAETSLSRRTYPPLLRDYIQDYFNSLKNQ